MKLLDLIDVSVLQKIQDGFSEFSGMAALVTDEQGVPITRGSGFTKHCTEVVRKSPIGCERCEKCDKSGAENAYEQGTVCVYTCHTGLTDFASPIMVGNTIVGSFIGGQALTKEYSDEEIRAVAADLEIDGDEYLETRHGMDICDIDYVNAVARFLSIIANTISEMAYSNHIAKHDNYSVNINEQIYNPFQLFNRINNLCNDIGSINYIFNIDSAIPERLYGESNLISQLLINIINEYNAAVKSDQISIDISTKSIGYATNLIIKISGACGNAFCNQLVENAINSMLINKLSAEFSHTDSEDGKWIIDISIPQLEVKEDGN